MIKLPSKLAAKLKSNDLRGITPIAYLYRNKWDAEAGIFKAEEKFIDISPMLVKCGALSGKLEEGEISEYTTSNVTLTLSDPKNLFVEGAPESYFPAGYQIYGSQVELYMGTGPDNMTQLFTGVIRSLPNFKPEKYQLDLVLVSKLELLKDIEAKDFSDKYTGEVLALDHQEDGENPFYRTAHTGVGGFSAVYADGIKLAEGVDYKITGVNTLSSPALVELSNKVLHGQTITADYYIWKRNLQIHEIVDGLLEVANWPSQKRDVHDVAWNSSIRSYEQVNRVRMALGYYWKDASLKFNWLQARGNLWENTTARNEQTISRRSIFPNSFETEFTLRLDDISGATAGFNASYGLGDALTSNSYYKLLNGVVIICQRRDNLSPHSLQITIGRAIGGRISFWEFESPIYQGVNYLETPVKIRKQGSLWSIYLNNKLAASFTYDINVQYETMFGSRHQRWSNLGQTWRILDDEGNYLTPPLMNPCIVSDVLEKAPDDLWGAVNANLGETDATYKLSVFLSEDGKHFDNGQMYDLGIVIGQKQPYMYYIFQISSPPNVAFEVKNQLIYRLTSFISFGIVNLTGRSVLEALQDLSLISGYEFGLDRNDVFFFQPRQTSTTPVYVLDKNELVKIDTVTRELNSLFTKLTLSFGEQPLEFYADTGDRPTPVDRYGIRNKDIDMPDIVSYENPELAQAIGPQLLEIYSALSRKITCVARMNLELELGDIVNLKRDMPLTVPAGYSDYTKYKSLNTFYRACKIVGLSYDFQKRQVKYTLRDVSNKNTEPIMDFIQYQTQFPIPLKNRR